MMCRKRLSIVLAVAAGAGLFVATSVAMRRKSGKGPESGQESAASHRGRPESGRDSEVDRRNRGVAKLTSADPNGIPTRRPPTSFPTPSEVLESSKSERPTRALSPSWKEGDEWIVHTWLRQMHQPRGGWSKEPIRFRYRVKGLARFDGADCRKVVVDLPDAADFRPETFFVDGRSYALRGLARTSREKGEWVPRTHHFGPGDGKGSSARNTSVPFDLPGAGTVGTVSAGDDAFTTLRFSEPGAPRPTPDHLVGAGGEYTEITIASIDGTIRQRWAAEDSRWPVESVSNEARSYRLR